jgi:phosphotriesterase-related protein
VTPRILTVRGPIEPSQLGLTLSHEHLFVDAREHWSETDTATASVLKDAVVTPELLALVRLRPFSTTLDNLVLGDEVLMAKELGYFRRAGGSAVVDLTSIGMRRDPRALLRLSRETGLHLIMGGGCYVERAHPEWVAGMSIAELAQKFADDILVGVDGTGIRSGIIGEVGVSGFAKGSRTKQGHITASEEKVLRAAGQAAVKTGVAIAVHLDFRSLGAFHVLDLLDEEGVVPERVVICHMDLVDDVDYHRAVASRGAYVEHSCFGREFYDPTTGQSSGIDRSRIDLIKQLVVEGLGDRILISHDVFMKIDLRSYGGNGFDFVPTAVVERMLANGITSDAIYQILIENPRRVLSVNLAEETLASIEQQTRLMCA